MTWTQEGTLADGVIFRCGNDQIQISICKEQCMYPLLCTLNCGEEQSFAHALSILLPIYPSLRYIDGSSCIFLNVEQWTKTFVTQMTDNIVKAVRNGNQELRDNIETEFKKFGRFAPWDTHKDRKNDIWCHAQSFRYPSRHFSDSRECAFTTSLQTSAIKQFYIGYQHGDILMFVEGHVDLTKDAKQVKPDYWRVDCKLSDVPNVIHNICAHDTTGCLLQLLETDLRLLQNLTLEDLALQSKMESVADSKDPLPNTTFDRELVLAELARVKKQMQKCKHAIRALESALTPKQAVMECACVYNDQLVWGDSNGDCFISRLDGTYKELLFHIHVAKDYSYTFLFMRQLSNGNLAIACLPDGHTTLRIWSDDDFTDYNPIFGAPQEQRNMYEYNKQLLLCDGYKSLTLLHSNGMHSPFLFFEKNITSYAVHEQTVFVTIDDELRIFDDGMISESIILPHVNGLYTNRRPYAIQLVTDDYVFLDEHCVVRFTGHIITNPFRLVHHVETIDSKIYALEQDTGFLFSWSNEEWVRCPITDHAFWAELLCYHNTLFGVTRTRIEFV